MKTLEHNEQVALFQWIALMAEKAPELANTFAIPNGGYRNKATAARLRAEGVRAGVSDIFLPHAVEPFHGMFLELKASKGTLQANQKEFITAMEKEGYYCCVCYGCEQAIKAIKVYLKRPELEE